MDTTDKRRLPELEFLGDATQFATRIHGMVGFSPLFENLNIAEIRLLGHFMETYRAQAGQTLIREGDEGDFLVFVIEGRIEVFKNDPQGAPRLIALVEPGRTLGEMSMIDGEPRFATCVAAEATLIAALAREDLARIILEQPILGAKLLMELALMLSQRLRETSARLLRELGREQGRAPGARDEGHPDTV